MAQTIALRDSRYPPNAWIRTCQECGYKQVAKSPESYKSDSWRDVKCHNCRSEALDYGTINEYVLDDEE